LISGKSTVMRMTAVGVIMAQLGMFVPASKARLSPVDTILTRMGAYDNMFSNASTFKVELDECCKVLRDATPKSFVILDELGRGTSTFDGMAIAAAVLHQLATHTLPLSFFATHYGSLADDFAYHPNIRNMHMSTVVDEERRELIFLYKLIDGSATGSFGTHVAKLAGVPKDVINRADVVSQSFANQFKARLAVRKERSASYRIPLVAQADFVHLHRLATDDSTSKAVNEVQRSLSLMKLLAKSYASQS
jgi:DNA mismatch repair protein MSH6